MKTNSPALFAPPGESSKVPLNQQSFQLVPPHTHLLGEWNGYLPRLEDSGVKPTVTFVSDIAGNPVGGRDQGVTHADNLGINLDFDLNKLAGLPGGSFLASMSQREGDSLSKEYIGNVFPVQQVYGGHGFKVIDLAYQQDVLDNQVEFRLGRLAAGDDFLVSPYDWVFMENAFDGNPIGIFFNAPGMTAYPAGTWGARVRVKPTAHTYLMAGIYSGDTSIRGDDHHGLDLSMNGPAFVMAEAAYHPNSEPGDTGLIGNYKVGFWYDDSDFTDYRTVGYGTPPRTGRGNWGLYAMADQILLAFAERSSNRGFGVFGSALISPDESVSQMPYFFTAGVAARGFLDARPGDVLGFGVAFGEFSGDLREAQEREQLIDPTVSVQQSETVLEWTYRFFFHQRSVVFQPDIQYIIQPGGTGKIDNALVFGCQIGFYF